MEKRVLLAVALSFIVFYAYQAYFTRPTPPGPRNRPPAAAPASSAPSTQPAAGSLASAAQPAPATPPAAPTAAAPAPAALVADSSERDVVVETQSLRAVFANRGARLKSWRLKKYLDLQKRPQELVPTAMPPDTPLPFDLEIDDAVANARLREALFLPSEEGTLDAAGQARSLTFEFKDASGLWARKTFEFAPGSFVVRFSAQVQVGDRVLNPTIKWGPGLGDVTAGKGSSYSQKPEAMVFNGDKAQRLSAKDITAQPVREGQYPVAGVDDQYFISMALPNRPVRVEYRAVTVPASQGDDPKNVRDYVAYSVRQQGGTADGLKFFFGPKDFDVLAAVGRPLVRVINFGIFDWLAVPLLRALKWINGSVGNYGWSIIILTLLINLVMFPLRHKSVVSMRKMQELQPEIKAIQERYSKLKMGDPEKQKMNVEMMNLYRERGVNPASGCIPMLLTFPVLFAFYSLLSQAIEIRGAPFALWIRDLSAHDPLYVTPILMGITMVWQQKMTPSSADPMQQKMMMAMPLVFTFMFLWAPSGLVIYWLLSNLLAISQQYVTNAIVGPPKISRPPAERKLKRAAGNS